VRVPFDHATGKALGEWLRVGGRGFSGVLIRPLFVHARKDKEKTACAYNDENEKEKKAEQLDSSIMPGSLFPGRAFLNQLPL
jgi:hypothetical protein